VRLAVFHALPMGGARRAAVELTTRLANRHDVTVFELALASDAPVSWPDSVAVQRSVVTDAWLSRRNRRVAELLLLPTWQRRMRQVGEKIDSMGFDALIAHPCRVTQAPGLLNRMKTPSVYYMHEVRRTSYEAAYRPPSVRVPPTVGRWLDHVADAWPRRVDRRSVGAATALVCNSAFTAERILAIYARVARVSYLGVDETHFTLPDGRSDAEDRYALTVGGLERIKCADLVIRALGEIPPPARPKLIIVGQRSDEEYAHEMQKLASQLGVHLRILPAVAEHELVHLYQHAVVTCCASRLEPFGLSAVESLACGTPVVAVREGGFREVVVDGVNGRLVERNPEAMGAAMATLSARRLAPASLRQTVIPRFTWASAVDRLEPLIEAVALRRSAAS
jgi:glycosyltransferase involved in cell wall biosynthesis